MQYIALVESFYGGSHRQLIDLLEKNFSGSCDKYYMTDKKWHWRVRTSSFHFAQKIPKKHNYRCTFCIAVPFICLCPVNACQWCPGP